MKINRYLFAFLAGMILFCPHLKAATNYVSLTGSHISPYLNWATAATNIQDAVDVASGGDMVLVSNGTYVLSAEIVVTEDITIKGLNGSENTIVDGDDSVRCMNLGSTFAVLNGFTVQRGKKDSGPINGYGGGVYCEGYNPVITNCLLTLNSGWYGGSVFGGTLYDSVFHSNMGVAGGALYESMAYDCVFSNNAALTGGAVVLGVIESCVLYNNSASEQLGGAMRYGTAINCIVSNNYAMQDGGGFADTLIIDTLVISNISVRHGGGLYRCVSSNSFIEGNYAMEDGGGLYRSSIYGGQIKNNSADGNGGGLYESSATNCIIVSNSADGSGGGGYKSTVVTCQVVSNTAVSGAGLHHGLADNSIILDNIADVNYGGMNKGSISNCTIVGNSAGLFYGGVGNADTYNSIIWDNTAPNLPNIFGGIIQHCSSPDLTHGIDGNITNHPVFVGAVTNNYRLTKNSPCVNRGDNSYVAGSTDLAGNIRISEGAVDMGAYEYVELDMDGDIMSDAWEVAFFGASSNVSITSNNDGDDYLDWQEFILGSNPTNGDSAFVFENNPASSTNGFGMDFTSATGRLYTIECTTELGSDNWTFLTNILGNGSVIQLIDPALLSNCFYRVRVELDR